MVLPAPGLSDAHAHALNARAHAHGRSTSTHHSHRPYVRSLSSHGARGRAGRPAAGTGPSSSRCGSDAACRCRPIDRRALWWCAAHSSNAAHSSPPCISRPSFLPELTSGQPRHGCHGRIGRRMARGVGAWSRAITPTSREPLVSRRMSPDAPNSHCLPSTACCRSDTHLYETGQAVSVHAERLRRPSPRP